MYSVNNTIVFDPTTSDSDSSWTASKDRECTKTKNREPCHNDFRLSIKTFYFATGTTTINYSSENFPGCHTSEIVANPVDDRDGSGRVSWSSLWKSIRPVNRHRNDLKIRNRRFEMIFRPPRLRRRSVIGRHRPFPIDSSRAYANESDRRLKSPGYSSTVRVSGHDRVRSETCVSIGKRHRVGQMTVANDEGDFGNDSHPRLVPRVRPGKETRGESVLIALCRGATVHEVHAMDTFVVRRPPTSLLRVYTSHKQFSARENARTCAVSLVFMRVCA